MLTSKRVSASRDTSTTNEKNLSVDKNSNKTKIEAVKKDEMARHKATVMVAGGGHNSKAIR